MCRNLLKYGLMVLVMGLGRFAYTQSVAINSTGAFPNTSAILDLSNSASLALLCPQVSLANIATLAPVPVPGPAGLLVYNTNATTIGGSGTGYYYWNGTQWNYLSTGGASTGWNLTGNTGTTPGTNYIGTNNAIDFVIKTAATERMRILSAGGVGIGTPTPKSALDVNGGTAIGIYAGVNAAPANGLIVSGQIGIGTNAPNASAAVDITSTTMGFLLPRMTTAQITALTPTLGLMAYNSTTNCIEYYSGIAWTDVVCPCAGAPATPGVITGTITLCTSEAGYVYSIAAVAGATSYSWTVPGSVGTITSGQGTTSITITAASSPGSGTIIVTASNNCGTSGAQSINISVVAAHGTQTFVYTGAVQTWAIPSCVSTMTISAIGAAGGTGNSAVSKGATITGVCTVTPGDNLSIVAASQGQASTIDGSGGGGGSYVWDATTTTLLVVGAGGGGCGYTTNKKGGDGGINVVTNAVTVGVGGNGAGGTLGNGGHIGTNGTGGNGTGGAGWISNGFNEVSAYPCTGGSDRANGFAGGIGYTNTLYGADGGYGGGGGGGWNGGGGGGGYNGGGGGNGNSAATGFGAGGGGSYLNGTLSATAQTNTGNGSVTITW